METPTILPILKRIPLFADLTEAEHKEIISHIVLEYFPVGYVFFHEGDTDGSMFIIKHGMVKVSRKDEGGTDRDVAILSDNDFFGEMALVLNEKRNASVKAISDIEVFQLKHNDFLKLMESSPTMAQKISTEFVQRVKKNKLQDNHII